MADLNVFAAKKRANDLTDFTLKDLDHKLDLSDDDLDNWLGKRGRRDTFKRSKSVRTGKKNRRMPTDTTAGDKKLALNDIVQLNVGGKRFDTLLRTLLIDRSGELFSQFIGLLEGSNDNKTPIQDADGRYFLDRDPEHFRTLLNNLRYIQHLQEKNSLDKSIECASLDEDGKPTKPSGIWSRIRGAK